MRDFLHYSQSILGGILALSLYGGVFLVVHEVVRPSGRDFPIAEEIREGIIDVLEKGREIDLEEYMMNGRGW